MRPSQPALGVRFGIFGTATIAVCLLASCALAIPADATRPGQHWVATWGAAQQVADPANELPAPQWRDASLRQIVPLSLGGSRFRVRISNVFGTEPLYVEGASAALAVAPGKPDVVPQSMRQLTFNGSATVMVPAGAEYYSDSVAMELEPASNLAVSLYFKGEPKRQTSHSGSRANSFLAKGNRVTEAAWADAGKVTHWYVLSDVEVQAPAGAGTLVVLGDSITDGYGVTVDANNRWTDVLAARLRQDGQPVGMVNAGIGGGRMLRDGLGPNLAARFDREVLSRAGVTHALVLIGVNDLGGQHRSGQDSPADRKQLLADLQMAHRQLAERAHAHGICMIGGTVTPYVGSGYYHPEPENEADRQQLNDWIRHSGVFDAVVDFDAALRDGAQPQRMDKAYDSGDGLHPSLAGYRALADAVPLPLLRQRCGDGR